MSEVLFTITKENLETGLRGVPVGYCTTSFVDSEKGLHYLDIPVSELHTWDPEEVIFLLYHGKKGEKKEVEEFKSELRHRQVISEEIVDKIENIPTKGTPMEVFCCAIMILGMYEKKRDYEEDFLNLTAKLPHLAAIVINTYSGWGKTPSPDPQLGYMENFTNMLNVPNKNTEQLLDIFRLFNILHFDHGGGNLSCFTGKTVASGKRHLYGSISAAMNALSGPLHGKANQEGLRFVEEIHKELKEKDQELETLLKERLSEGNLISGFGHAVLRVEDPRATLFYEYGQKHFPEDPLVKTALLLRSAATKVLKENPKISNPYPNVDAMSGTVLVASGFNYPQFFTLLFGLSRSVGISIQILYERKYARKGKGVPITRPRYIYSPRPF